MNLREERTVACRASVFRVLNRNGVTRNAATTGRWANGSRKNNSKTDNRYDIA